MELVALITIISFYILMYIIEAISEKMYIKEIKRLEDENLKLKRLVDDLFNTINGETK